ncbi:MAG: hypothetical protein EOM34_09720 [Clostridia bacterium]|nr:hypothetical protein [Lachnospiraceae bacterium]NCC00941.1 hypothetical protein [Clostridia bacterium]NCD02399.1 hypothetical protein [Clostridia bacterium]
MLRTVIVILIVSWVLEWFKKISESKAEAEGTGCFIVRLPVYFAIVGLAELLMIMGILTYGQLPASIGITLVLGLATLPGIFLALLPMAGAWDVIVELDDITVTRAFVFKTHWKMSQITQCKETRGGIHVYVKGREERAFFMSKRCVGIEKFRKRMEEKRIPIEEI